MEEKVYILFHEYEFGKKGDVRDETKLLGAYSSEEKVKEAIEFYYKLPGFCDYPKECFSYDEYPVGKCVGWLEGFFDTDDYDFEEVEWDE